MYTSDELTSLANLGEGAAIELFDIELQKVLENLDDPNTIEEKIREIKLTVKFKPGQTQGVVAVLMEVKSSLAPPKEAATALIIGRGLNGRMEAREMLRQRKLPFDDKVVPMKDKSENQS